jgi:hypothetical protein
MRVISTSDAHRLRVAGRSTPHQDGETADCEHDAANDV